MKFTITRGSAWELFNNASKVLAQKNTMPILDCFLISIKEGKINITASDGEKFFNQSADVIESDGDFTFCVNAKTIVDSMKNVGEQPVTFSIEGTTLVVEHMNGSFKLSVVDADPFPVPTEIGEAQKFEVDSDTIINAINYGLYATANDEIRLVMTGLYFDVKPNGITFAATDGRRLVRYISQTQVGVEAGFIMPKKVCSIIKGMLSGGRGVSFEVGSELVKLSFGDSTFLFRQIEGRYPNYNAVFPPMSNNIAVVDRQSMLAALKRVGVFCNKSSGLIAVDLKDNKMEISGQDLEFATSAVETLECSYTSEHIKIGLNCDFLHELLSSFNCEHVNIVLTDASRPAVVTPSGDDSLTAMLMPMMLQ